MHLLNDIRSRFLGFFKAREHHIVPSAPLVPQKDPTLLFVNAGMVPFKNVFTGHEAFAHRRAASSQKCMRAGGKHNDLDNVGYTARHHTFFEMLGNFSFGDYFKEEAIAFAWELVHRQFGLPRDRLLVTVYHTDDDAFRLWKRISGLPDARIIRINTNDNFWSMGAEGPCGPCSEIFFDHGEGIPGGPPGSPDEDGDRFVEIWNLVFMQFERHADGSRTVLPDPCVDTGMGLERIAAVLQGVHDNYDTDLFRVLISALEDLSAGTAAKGETGIAYRVIADHVRASAFLMADGVMPSNEGRGYVLRRIIRRSMRYASSLQGGENLLARLVPVLVSQMGPVYRELERAEPLVVSTLLAEEEKFSALLDRGLKILEEELSSLPEGKLFPGDAAFRLYDTYGFPLDLTQDALRARGRRVDTAGFDAAMQAQKDTARAAWAGSGDRTDEGRWFAVRTAHGPTEFTGFTCSGTDSRVTAIMRGGVCVDTVSAGDSADIVVDRTPFYAEAGGQTGDRGFISGADGFCFEVLDTVKRAGVVYVHTGKVTAGTLSAGSRVHMEIDTARRRRVCAGHSATHLVHAALKRVLGNHVVQKGSLVAASSMRFDFTNRGPVSPADIAEVERQVNGLIRQNKKVRTRIMSYDDAMSAGATGLFGEKYGNEVRVLVMGEDPDGSGMPFSMELCGGTHVRRTGDIGLFKIVSESGVSSGVRRIEVLTGEAARQYMEDRASTAGLAADVLKVPVTELVPRVESLVAERKKLARELKKVNTQSFPGKEDVREGSVFSSDIGGVRYTGRVLENIPPADLRSLVDREKESAGPGVIALISIYNGKAAFAVGVTADLTDRLSAVDLVRAGAACVGGRGGGGRPDLAQAGGPDVSRASDAIKAVADRIGSVLSDG